MNGRCDNDPLDRAENVCDKCGGDFCDTCLLYPRGRKRPPVCKACAIAHAGLRSTSKSQTPLERKNVRKRRKELQEQVDEHDDSQFVYFDEEGSDIELRDRSVLDPPVEEEPKRRFGKKTKTKSAETTSSKPKSSKAKNEKPKQDKPKKAKPAKADKSSKKKDDVALPPPPSPEDALELEEDLDVTIDLGEALSGYSSDSTEVGNDDHDYNDVAHADVADEPQHHGDPFADSASDTGVANQDDKPSASELLARLKEAETARQAEAASNAVPGVASNDPWIPAGLANDTADHDDEKVDVTVNPFADAAPAQTPMEAWVPPTVTADPKDELLGGTVDNDPGMDFLSYDEASSASFESGFELASFEIEDEFETASIEVDNGANFGPTSVKADHDDRHIDPGIFGDEPASDLFDPASFDLGNDDVALEPASFESASFEPDSFESASFEPASFDVAPSEFDPMDLLNENASFAHDPAFETDDFSAVAFEHDPGFGDDRSLEPATAAPTESSAGASSSSTKADTDDEGNWIPPALRGMAPKAVRDAETLPKRRGSDED